jgi:intracellular sulfur oxidation DsrE/DsrF family protein
MLKPVLAAALLLLPLAAAQAQNRENFRPGPVFPEFGPIANVTTDLPVPAGAEFKVAFDITAKATPGELSRSIETAGRFINMHAAAGVPLDKIKVAIVVHGPAGVDFTKPEVFAKRSDGKANGSMTAITALLAKGVQIHMCGQSATGQGLTSADLLPGVKMSLSAMTSHALLQQQGYTLNPF